MLRRSDIFESHTQSLIAITDEHAHLGDLLEQLKNVPSDQMELKIRILREILSESAQHFSHEEDVMLDVGCGHFTEHQNDHKNLLALIHNLISDYGDKKAADAATLIEKWIIAHSKEFDPELLILLS